MPDRYNRGNEFAAPQPILTVLTGRDNERAINFYARHYSKPHVHTIFWSVTTNIRDHMDELEGIFRAEPSHHAIIVAGDDCWKGIEPYVAYHPDWQIEWLAFEYQNVPDFEMPNRGNRNYTNIFVKVVTRRNKPQWTKA